MTLPCSPIFGILRTSQEPSSRFAQAVGWTARLLTQRPEVPCAHSWADNNRPAKLVKTVGTDKETKSFFKKNIFFFANIKKSHTFATHLTNAQMAESVDALVSNTSGATHPGSIPGLGTSKRRDFFNLSFYFISKSIHCTYKKLARTTFVVLAN